MTVTPASSVPSVATAGERTLLQVWPFQCRIRVWYCDVDEFKLVPTAQASVRESAETARSWSPPEAGFGVVTFFHERPVQCRARVRGACADLDWYVPTAHALAAEVTDTPLSVPPGWLGPLTWRQVRPFQCKNRFLSADPPSEPTAQAFDRDDAATAVSKTPPAGLGALTRDHFASVNRKISDDPA